VVIGVTTLLILATVVIMTCVCVAKKSKLKEKAASQPPYGRFNPTSFMNPQLTGKHVHQSLTYAIDEQRINY